MTFYQIIVWLFAEKSLILHDKRNSQVKTTCYNVAGHVFCVGSESDISALMENYEPFVCEAETNDEYCFALNVEQGERPDYVEEMRQEEEGQDIVCGHTSEGKPVFEFRWWNETAGWLVCDKDYREGRLVATGRHLKMAVDNALMVLYALATANNGTALFHASTVSDEGRAYMFLGKSGTGKSTHAGLWLKYIEGTALVNDDNPVVRVFEDGTARVYGSPWSGKTPCYRNVSYPLGGIVELSQAPYNRIRRLTGIQAYAALVPSISGKRWDAVIANGLHQTENALVMTVPMWHLECLPDVEAARVCNEKVKR